MRTLIFRRSKTVTRLYLIATLFVLLVFVVSPAYAEEPNSIDTLRQMGKAFATIAEKASPAVVSIRAEKVYTQQYYSLPDWPFGSPFERFFDDDFFDRFFQRDYRSRQPRQRKATRPVQGSGFIISPDGYILTNSHLVNEAQKVYVRIGESLEIKAEVVGTDPPTDVAVIKVNKENLPYLELADSDKLEVGEWVIAIGNPLGLSHTVTAGIVSAKGRSGLQFSGESPEYQDFIQTDAAINPGNSGGPLINLGGKAVGINAAIIGPGGNIGIGFAVPVNIAKNVYEKLVKEGKVVRGWLGIRLQDLTAEMAQSLDLKDTKGAIVPDIFKDSPAEKAGVKAGDIIIEFEGKPVENSKELMNRVATLKPGTKVKIVVLREGEQKTLYAELAERKAAAEEPAGEEPDVLGKLGFSIQNLTDELAEQLGYRGLSGVVITQVEQGSLAQYSGLTAGALIMQVNQKKIKNTQDFYEEIKNTGKDGGILLLVKDRSGTRFVTLRIED